MKHTFELHMHDIYTVLINLQNVFRNFRPFTRAADNPHQSIFAIMRKNFNRLPALADNPHSKTKKSRRLSQSVFIVLVDLLSFSVH